MGPAISDVVSENSKAVKIQSLSWLGSSRTKALPARRIGLVSAFNIQEVGGHQRHDASGKASPAEDETHQIGE